MQSRPQLIKLLAIIILGYLGVYWYASYQDIEPSKTDLMLLTFAILCCQINLEIPKHIVKKYGWILLTGTGFYLATKFLGHAENIFLADDASDQSYYASMFRHIKDGTFIETNYMYGLAYPLMGLFANLFYAKDPFALVDLVCYLFTVLALFYICYEFTRNYAGAAFATLFFARSHYVFDTFGVPWTSTPVCAMYCWAFYWLIAKKPLSTTKCIAIGIFAGISFAARYVDVVLFLPILAYFVLQMRARSTDVSKYAVLGSLTAAAAIAGLVLYSHYYFFGSPFETPYRFHGRPAHEGTSDQDPSVLALRFGIPMLQQFVGTIFDVTLAWDFETLAGKIKPVAFQLLPIFFIPAGVFLNLKSSRSEARSRLLVLLIGLVMFLGIYSLHPGACPGCLQFGSAHYFKPLLPWAAMGFSLVAVKLFSDVKGVAYPTLGAAAIIASVDLFVTFAIPRIYELSPKTFRAGQEIRLRLDFKNRWGRPIIPGYLKVIEKSARLKAHRNGGDFEMRGTVTDAGDSPDRSWDMTFPGSEKIDDVSAWEVQSFLPTPQVIRREN